MSRPAYLGLDRLTLLDIAERLGCPPTIYGRDEAYIREQIAYQEEWLRVVYGKHSSAPKDPARVCPAHRRAHGQDV